MAEAVGEKMGSVKKWGQGANLDKMTPFIIYGTIVEELRSASGRAGAAVGASRASCSPGCGTLCCRRRGMGALLHVGL
jgi:hypothetical protein